MSGEGVNLSSPGPPQAFSIVTSGCYSNLNFILVFVPMYFVSCQTRNCLRAGAGLWAWALSAWNRAGIGQALMSE